MADEKEQQDTETEKIEVETSPSETSQEPTRSTDTEPPAARPTKVPKKSFKEWVKSKHGKITLAIIAAVILIVSVLFIVPATRYGIVGTFMRKDVTLSVVDSKTGKPVSDAEVSVPGTTSRTDKDGRASLSQVPVGQYKLTVKKKHFKDTAVDLTVPILAVADAGQLTLEATGRQVPISVTNKITGQALGKATITADESTAITDDKGEAVLVMPASATAVKAAIKADGYNDQEVEVTVTEQKDDKNKFAMVPSGKLYYLSKRTGKINVMKSNLDGSDAKVVVQGTGREEEGGTVLLASRDWKYLALKARRDSDQAKLYLINTSNDQMGLIDEGNAEFTLSGWNGHAFVYQVNRLAVKSYQPKKYALKAFDADANKLITLDETQAEGSEYGYRYEEISRPYILDSENRILFTKNWSTYNASVERQNTVTSVQANGANKKVLKTFDLGTYVYGSILYKPNEIYYSGYQGGNAKYFEYESGVVREAPNIKAGDFDQFYPTWLLSPSGEKTFWYEPRDGKNTLFIGNKLGEEGKEVATLSELKPYGWHSDNYLLLSKGGSELYVMPANNPDPSKAIKITDYHKPAYEFYGYGGGYGGL